MRIVEMMRASLLRSCFVGRLADRQTKVEAVHAVYRDTLDGGEVL